VSTHEVEMCGHQMEVFLGLPNPTPTLGDGKYWDWDFSRIECS